MGTAMRFSSLAFISSARVTRLHSEQTVPRTVERRSSCVDTMEQLKKQEFPVAGADVLVLSGLVGALGAGVVPAAYLLPVTAGTGAIATHMAATT